jgi:hypothetical protein
VKGQNTSEAPRKFNIEETKMRMLSRALIGLVICSASILCVGCLQSETTETRLILNGRLSGDWTMRVTHISSDEKDLKKQRAEMRNFYKETFSDSTSEAIQNGLKDFTATLYNRTPLSCDAVLTAKFDNLLTVLPLVISLDKAAGYELVKRDGRLSVKISAGEFSKDAGDYFSITYDRVIIAHNAHSYDPESHTIKWNLREAGKEGIYFVLQLEPEDGVLAAAQ